MEISRSNPNAKSPVGALGIKQTIFSEIFNYPDDYLIRSVIGRDHHHIPRTLLQIKASKKTIISYFDNCNQGVI